MDRLLVMLFVVCFINYVVGPPVDPKKKEKPKAEGKEKADADMDDFGLEYGRYLQQVVQALEEDKEFAKKLENITADQIRSGAVAKELDFVKHSVRNKLDELKRMELERLRKLVQQEMERSELGLYRDEEGHLVAESPDGRRWRTIPQNQIDARGGGGGGVGGGDFWLGLDRKKVKLPNHLNIHNPHTFEVDDLKRLIQTATKDLEELDRKRREEFKQYEIEKEAKYRESLKNMSQEERNKVEKHHEEMMTKHKEHPKIHHPGSKPQLEQVWVEEDNMRKDEFEPRTFFAYHDVNGDKVLDEKEIEAILRLEVKKMYDPKNEEDDPVEMEEEYHRMREHIFNETDKNKDGLISEEEFLEMTKQQDFEQDDGWKGLDEQNIYTEEELQEYMRRRQEHGYQPYYGDPQQQQQLYYQVPNAGHHEIPPEIHYQAPHYQGGQPQQFQGAPPQHPQFQGLPPQQQAYYQGVPPQHPQYAGVPPQQQGVPQHLGQGISQQHPPQGVPQHHPGQGIPQQLPPQGVPQQHLPQGVPQQHLPQGVPQQHPPQGVPQQHPPQGVPQQHSPQGVPQQHPPQGVPQQNIPQGVPHQQQPQSIHQQQNLAQGVAQQQNPVHGVPPQHPQEGVPQYQQANQGVPANIQDGSHQKQDTQNEKKN